MNTRLLWLLGALTVAGRTLSYAENWPQFRGVAAAGVSTAAETPTTWSVETGENILWKTPIAGLGLSCPIVWEDRVFVTTAVGKGGPDAALKVGLYGDIAPVDENFEHEWRLICLERKTGKVLWDKLATAGVPQIKRHTKASHANSTPATDGNRVVAFFGAEGLFCYDMTGELKWKKNFGKLDSGFFMVKSAQWGFASSPIIHAGRVIVQCDVQENSFIAALDASDGREIWRTARTDVPTWSTPTVVTSGKRTQIVANGFREIAGYDFESGRMLWTMEGGGDIPVPTPITAHDLIYIASAHGPAAPLFAIRTDAEGDVEAPEDESTSTRFVPWAKQRLGVYMQTPIVVGEHIYGCRDNGVLSVFNAKTGEKAWGERLGKGGTGFTASAVACRDKLYYTSEQGDVFVLKAGDKPEILAQNSLGEVSLATPAIADGVIFFRGTRHVIAVGRTVPGSR
jgi:outer membrane protein assembly factor BamB